MMTDILNRLYQLGFDRVSVLDGRKAGTGRNRLILAFMSYRAASGDADGAVIHPYYPVSQQAYYAARKFAEECRSLGTDMILSNQIHIKSVLDHLPFLERGRNTLSYLSPFGSRFHIQVLTSDELFPVTDELTEEPHPVSCGNCRACARACPGGAITDSGFVKEKCLRYWMLNGQCPPEDIVRRMGNRLIGCDDCEACCPKNTPASGEPLSMDLPGIMRDGRTDELKKLIGANYARRQRILIQCCVLSASMNRKDLLPELLQISASASGELKKAADLAVKMLSVP
ncbi:MAG: hypothetical protein K6E17_04620 [Clostridiales bacterium]|nr:hypothetical protein [Clostridiales bacterium]